MDVGPTQGRFMLDNGCTGDEHLVTPAFVDMLTALGNAALRRLGFQVRELDIPVERLTGNGLARYTRAARIPSRFYAHRDHPLPLLGPGDVQGFRVEPIDIGNERDWWLILPSLPF